MEEEDALGQTESEASFALLRWTLERSKRGHCCSVDEAWMPRGELETRCGSVTDALSLNSVLRERIIARIRLTGVPMQSCDVPIFGFFS